MLNSCPFTTYHDNGNYASLDYYKQPELIITKEGKTYDCTKYLNQYGKYDSVEIMLPNIKLVKPLKIRIGKDLTTSNTVNFTVAYANYFEAPWYKQEPEDLDWYRLNSSSRFPEVLDVYYGTNYGTVWSTSSGKYLTPWYNRKNRDGNGYAQYRLLRKHISIGGDERIGIFGHWISAYFVFNPNPKSYNVVCHKDNNPSNNYYKNLYWGTQKQNIEQAASDNRTNRTINKTVILDIIEESNRAIQEGKSRQDVYEKYANLFGITSRTIYNLIDSYGLKNNLIAYNYKTQQKSKTELPYNVCTLANDYDKNGDYVLLDSYGRRDIIITVDHRAFYISKKTIDMYFPKDDKSVWPSIFELQEQPYLKEVVTKHPEKLQFNGTSCQYVPSKIARWSVLYDSYFGESPWYLRCVRGFDISYVQMSSHSEFSDVLDAYFLCSTGRIFTLSAGKYLNEYSKKNSDIKECSLGCKTNKKGMTRSIGVLLELFGFND